MLNCSCNVHSGITNKRVVYAVLISITSVYMIICYCLSRKPFRLLIMLNDKLSNCSSWRCHTGILFVMLYRVLINETSREVFVCKWNLIFNVPRAILNFVIFIFIECRKILLMASNFEGIVDIVINKTCISGCYCLMIILL